MWQQRAGRYRMFYAVVISSLPLPSTREILFPERSAACSTRYWCVAHVTMARYGSSLWAVCMHAASLGNVHFPAVKKLMSGSFFYDVAF